MWPTPAIVWDPWRCPPITRHVRRHNAKKLVQNEVFSHDLQCVEYGPRKLQKTQFSLVPRLCLDDSTQTKPPACPHGVGGCSPRCRIAWNGLHHPRESILAPIAVLGNLDLKNVWWILVLSAEKSAFVVARGALSAFQQGSTPLPDSQSVFRESAASATFSAVIRPPL